MDSRSDWGTETDGSPLTFWEGLHPSVRAAAIMWIFLLVIAAINSFTAGTSIVFCYPVQLLLYVANGYLAGHFALQAGHDASELPRFGAIAAVIAWIVPLVFYLVAGLVLGLATFGVGLVSLLGVVLCGPIDLAIHITCGAIGAWFAGRRSGTPSEAWD